jgi:hypothetical protein
MQLMIWSGGTYDAAWRRQVEMDARNDALRHEAE